MSTDLSDYTSVLQFLTSANFALSFESVLKFSVLGNLREKYHNCLLTIAEQFQAECSHLDNVKNEICESNDGERTKNYPGAFLLFFVAAFLVLFIAESKTSIVHNFVWMFWGGMILAFIGLFFWVFLLVFSLFRLLKLRVNLIFLNKIQYQLRNAVLEKDFSEKCIDQIVTNLNTYLGHSYIKRLLYKLFYDKKRLLEIRSKS